MNRLLYVIIIIIIISKDVFSQSIDRIEAIIGDEILLTSDIESQYLQYLLQGGTNSLNVRCEIIEDLLFQNLLIHQAKIDSIDISSEEISQEINKRLLYFESQLGSINNVEDYFGKSMLDIEKDLKDVIRNQFYAQRMQAKIVADLKVTPSEVKHSYDLLDLKDIPTIPTQVELLQIILTPKVSDKQIQDIKESLNDLRERVYNGESFNVLATLYSDDEASSTRGGELGFVNRGDLLPEFERVAFRLKEGEVSQIVETKYGFHIIKLIERRGEQINVRHILIKPIPDTEANIAALDKANEVFNEIKSGVISFKEAVIKYSDGPNKNNGGLFVNPVTMSTLYSYDDMSLSLKLLLEKIPVGEITYPTNIQINEGDNFYRIIKVNKRIDSHQANLVDDFTIIKDFTLNLKRQELLSNWIENKIKITYVKLNHNLEPCSFQNNWIK